MSDRKMIFIGAKESFIVRVLMKKVTESGIECEFVPFTVDDINPKLEDQPLVTLYLDDNVKGREDAIHFLFEKMADRGMQMILIGEQRDIDFVDGYVSKTIIYKALARPVDNDQYVKFVEEYFAKMNAGELKRSILVIDDDPQYLAIVREWLRESYKVTMVNSGLQGIKWLGKNKVDLILLDYEMPVTSGPQVLEMLRSDDETKKIPVIFLTGKSDKDSVMAVVSLRPEGYFLKTMQKDELLKNLKEFFVLHQ